MLRQLLIIFSCLAIGELFVWLTNINFPSSIIGMLVLTTILHFKIIKLKSVKTIADLLNKNIGLFFVPAGASIIFYFDLIKADILSIIIVSVVSTLLVIWTTGKSFTIARRLTIKFKHKK